jgi:hypothetical protein
LEFVDQFVGAEVLTLQVEARATHFGMRLTSIFLLVACDASAQTKPMGVCEALESPAGQREVVLRARLGGGHYHGWVLVDTFSDDPCPGWRRRFFTAPPWIPLYFSSDLGVQLAKEQERRNFEFLLKLYKLDRPSWVRPTITIRGVLVKQFWPLIFRAKDGQYIGDALGPHNNAALAVLIMTEPPILP